MSRHSSTLDDLILLNREIAALVKAGIPLELGLRGLSGSTSTRLGRLSERLSMRLAAGRSLPEALAEEGPVVSPVYTAVMEAGLASGRLPEALESLAASGQSLQETRRRVTLALLYPALCCLVGYLMFCLFLSVIAPQMIHAAEMFRFPASWPMDLLKLMHQHRVYATLVVPAIVLALIIGIGFFRSRFSRARRGLSTVYNNFCWLASCLPGNRWMRRLISAFDWINPAAFHRSLNWAQFTELLALQIEQNAPLPQAFSLAAESTDDVRWQVEARAVAEKLRQGASLGESLKLAKSMPPTVSWMLASAEKQETLGITLRELAEMYRRRAFQQASMLKTWIPVIMTICVTGGIGLAYGLAFFIPMRALLFGLMHE